MNFCATGCLSDIPWGVSGFLVISELSLAFLTLIYTSIALHVNRYGVKVKANKHNYPANKKLTVDLTCVNLTDLTANKTEPFVMICILISGSCGTGQLSGLFIYILLSLHVVSLRLPSTSATSSLNGCPTCLWEVSYLPAMSPITFLNECLILSYVCHIFP